MPDRAALVARLAAFPADLAAAARAAVARPVAVGEWTPDLVVRHLIAVEVDVHQARLADLDRGPEPHWSWTEPGPWTGEPDLDLDALLARFADDRAATLAVVGGLDAAGWARTGVHATFGVWDVAGLLGNAVSHDAEHLPGLEAP